MEYLLHACLLWFLGKEKTNMVSLYAHEDKCSNKYHIRTNHVTFTVDFYWIHATESKNEYAREYCKVYGNGNEKNVSTIGQ